MFVIATAEPYGAYHLKPIEAVLRSYDTMYLTPDDKPLQGVLELPRVFEVEDSVSAADIVIITGGNLNDWTREVAETGFKLGKCVIFLELAYLSIPPALKAGFSKSLALVIAGSEKSANSLQNYFNVDGSLVKVLGYPNNDNILDVNISPLPERTVLFLTNTETDVEGCKDLKQAAMHASAAGFEVLLRRHPRDIKEWTDLPEGMVTDVTHLNVVDVLRMCSHVVGSPGTTYFNATILKKPVFTLKSTFMDMVPEEILNLSYIAETPEELIRMLNRVDEPICLDNEYVTGPVENVVKNFDEAFRSFLKK